ASPSVCFRAKRGFTPRTPLRTGGKRPRDRRREFIGGLGGLVIGLSAYFQGRCAAAACDALGETGKGTSNYLIVIGIIETVALFTLVFCLLLLNSVAA
ncbi:MAG: hypothetical protein IJT52_05690, partial [Spirochaetales bacterium]|nr:hypothetical protein [Spirochaetales bacterium]